MASQNISRSMKNILVSRVLSEVTSLNICHEIDGVSESYMFHVVPQEATTECGKPRR